MSLSPETSSPALPLPGSARERRVALVGSPNFRDAGGYACAGGSLAWGQLFRSGHLADLSGDDLETLERLQLELVVDLRRQDERAFEPSQLPAGIPKVGADITPGSQASVIYADSTQLGGAEAMFQFMCDINREFVESQTATFRGVFQQVLDSGASRVLFHCSAGKDRTGFAIAALQLALGVALDDVEEDYLLSRRYYLPEAHMARVRQKYPVAHLSDDDLRPMLQADITYLHGALAAMRRGHGDADTYLKEGLGLDDSARRELRRRFVSAP